MGIKIDDDAPKTYIVLGAPHSATSLIAKGLHDNGIDMHPFHKNYEDLDFEEINYKILNNKNYKKELKALIKDRKKQMWGWKDPKTCLTLDKYFPYLDGDVYLFACFRRPKKVVENWERTKHTRGGKELLDKYNNNLLKNIKKFLEW